MKFHPLWSFDVLARLLTLAWTELRRPRVSLPLLTLWIAYVLLFWTFADPTLPLWGWIVAPGVKSLFGGAALHYPESWIGLPTTAGVVRLVLDLMIWPILAAWISTGALASAKGQKWSRGAMWATSLRMVPLTLALTLAWTMVWVIVVVAPVTWLGSAGILAGKKQAVAQLVLGGTLIAVATPVLFVLPARIDHGRPLRECIAQSIETYRRHPMVSLVLALLPFTVGFPFAFVLSRSTDVADLFRPEMVLALMVSHGITAGTAVYFSLHTAARLWVHRRSQGPVR